MLRSQFSILLTFILATLAVSVARPSFAEPISIAEVKHDGDVDFEREILPIFRRNCLACHSATEAQSDLVLESPQSILKGGSEGPSVVAGKSAESLLLKLAAKQKEPHMPPPDNDVKAKPLTPQELGLIKLWIDQGAKGDVKGAAQISWQPLPTGVNPIYAVAIDAGGQFAAASRANQIFMYHVPSKREVGRLTDPALIERGLYEQPGVADLDLVQSLKFSPDGALLASGGFRTVKLWRKPAATKLHDLAGVEANAKSLATSADGQFAAVGDESGAVKLFDIASGKVVHTLTGHSAAATAAAFTADSKFLITGSTDKTLRSWSVAAGQQLASVETPAAINAVALVADGKQVATGGADNVIRLWELSPPKYSEKPQPVKELTGHTGPVTSLTTLGSQLASGSQDGTVQVWDLASGKSAKTFKHDAPIAAIAASPDGKRLASVGGSAAAKLWNVESGQPVAELKGDLRKTLKAGELTRIAAIAKKHVELTKKDLEDAGKRKTAEEENQKKAAEALTKAETDLKPKVEAAKKAAEEKTAADKALADATAAKTKSEEGKKAAEELLAKAAEALKSVKAAQDSAGKLTGDEAAAAKTATEKAVAEIAALGKLLEPGKAAAEKSVTDAIAAFSAAEKKVKEFQPTHQKAIDEETAATRTLETAKRGIERAAEAVKKAAEAIPPAEVLVKAAEAAAKERDAELAAATAAAKESDKPVHAVSFAPDGGRLVTIGDDGLLRTWEAESGAPLDVEGTPAGPLTAVRFGPGGTLVAAGGKSATAWRLPIGGKLERTLGSPDDTAVFADRITALDFSPDGKLLAVGGGEPSRSGEIKLFNSQTGELVLTLKEPHSDTVNCLAFSPDGKQLASCGADRFVKLWNVADGKFIRSFEGHTHHVLGVSWRADGRMLVSSGADLVLKVWDTRTGDQLRTVQNQFTKEVTSVNFLADGDLVVASGGDAKVRLINATNGNNQRDLGGPADYMYSAAASADGKTIVAGGLDSVVRLWNDQGQEIAKFTPPPQAKDQTAAK